MKPQDKNGNIKNNSMPTKNVQMNSDEEILKEFDRTFQQDKTGEKVANWLFAVPAYLYPKENQLAMYVKIATPDDVKTFLRSALSQARKDEREKCGKEIVEALEKYKFGCVSCGKSFPDIKTMGKAFMLNALGAQCIECLSKKGNTMNYKYDNEKFTHQNCAETGCKTVMTHGSPKYCPEHNEMNVDKMEPSIVSSLTALNEK